MPVVMPSVTKKRTVTYRDARGRTKNAKVIAAGGSKVRAISITTVSGQAAITGTGFSQQDVGAALTGNNANTGSSRTILSVEDATNATMSGNATGSATASTTFTRTAALGGVKIILGSIAGSGSVIDDVPLATAKTSVLKIFSRRGPA